MKRYRIGIALCAALLPVFLVPPTRTDPASTGTGAAALPKPEPGYHHLGATTNGTWSGVLGRLSVRNPTVRPGSYDFVAVRFMAKATTPEGVKWLEAGWSETGWSDGGHQQVYSFDTNTNRWAFYPQYQIKDGDQIWIELEATGPGPDPVWSAWLWWGDSWQLLTSQPLPIGDHATIEEYVEVYVDPKIGGTIKVPPIEVDNVGLKPDPGTATTYWTSDNVTTTPGTAGDGYCLNWQIRYDSWNAGTC